MSPQSWAGEVLGELGEVVLCSRCDLARSSRALPPAAVRVLCPVTVSGEIKVAVQKKPNPKMR